jgi:hypothetical protein
MAIWHGSGWRLMLSFLGLLAGVATMAFVPASLGDTQVRVPNSQEQPTCLAGGDGIAPWRVPNAITYTVFLPEVSNAQCGSATGETYGSVAVIGGGDGRPAETHPDLNLAVRGYVRTDAFLGMVDYGSSGSPDSSAPQLAGLFGNNRVPAFPNVYKVYDWDWECDCRGGLLDDYDVTLAGMGTTAGEIIHVPASGYDIGRIVTGYEVMVLYAARNRITLKYTREDDVISGYTIHVENICVDPNLLSLYQSTNAAGRARLPALFSGQGVGRAIGNEIQVAIRDTGSFMDPRSHSDWWQGR